MQGGGSKSEESPFLGRHIVHHPNSDLPFSEELGLAPPVGLGGCPGRPGPGGRVGGGCLSFPSMPTLFRQEGSLSVCPSQ